MRGTVVALIAAGLTAANPLDAQPPMVENAAVGVTPRSETGRPRPRVPKTPGNRFAARVTLGALGFAGGAFAGGIAGISILGRDCGGCDDPGLDSWIKGARVGAIVGTAVTVGSIALGDGCARGSRTVRALIGGTAGHFAGMLLASKAGSDQAGDFVAWLAPGAGTVIGASWMAATCVGNFDD